jgi:hypothetical protein
LPILPDPGTTLGELMSDVAKPIKDEEVEFVDEDNNSVGEIKKAVSGFTPTQKVSWPGDASPPREPESGAAEAHHITRGQHAKVNKVLDAREEAEKARQEDHRADPGTGIEAKYATGFSRQAGKHTAHTGPLTRRSGRLKIFPESIDQDQLYDDLEKLRAIARQVLHGRNATIFEKLVIKPLADGVRHPPVKDVASEFNIEDGRVYKIIHKCWNRISKARARFEADAPVMEKDKSRVRNNQQSRDPADRSDPQLHYWHRQHDKWPWPEDEDEERRLRFYKEENEKWENTYGVNRPYGPKCNAK